METSDENPPGIPEPVADLLVQLNHARSEAEDAKMRLDLLRSQYGELEAICGTQAEDLVRLRKADQARAALQQEREKLTARLTHLQSEVGSMRSVVGTMRLVVWQIRRLPGLLLGRK
jgi:chromosome segregation ATPase